MRALNLFCQERLTRVTLRTYMETCGKFDGSGDSLPVTFNGFEGQLRHGKGKAEILQSVVPQLSNAPEHQLSKIFYFAA